MGLKGVSDLCNVSSNILAGGLGCPRASNWRRSSVGSTHRIVECNDVACCLRDQAGVRLLQHHRPEHLLLGMCLALVVADDLTERDLQADRQARQDVQKGGSLVHS